MTMLLSSIALAAGPPCVPLSSEFHVEGEHFWVQWDAPVADEQEAQQVLAWAEEARATYKELGWEVTDETLLIRIQESPSNGGLCSTTECEGGVISPVITLFSTAPGKTTENTTKHEVVHAFEYAYMGTYLDAITSWSWWVEGTATWLTTHADGDLLNWRLDARDYLENPWIGLHQPPTAYSDPVLSDFLYGTAFIAQYLEDEHGMDAVRQTWEFGGEHTGTPLYFPDVIEGVGIPWEPFWQDYLASVSVLDTPYGGDFAAGAFIEKHVRELPAEGTPKKSRQPQGMGLSIIHFASAVGQADRSLEVSFEGDPSVPWIGVLVKTRRPGPGGKVKEIIPLSIEEGQGSATLADFDGSREAYLVVSPQDISLEPRDFTWKAELGGGPEAPTSKGPGGCGCASAAPSLGGWALLLALMGLRRRRLS